VIRFGRFVWTAAAIAVAVPTYAQSLGEIARQEEVRRGTGTKSVKTLSNADLDPSATAPAAAGSPVSSVSCYVSKQTGGCISAEQLLANSHAGMLKVESVSPESKWRAEAESIRSQIARTQRSIATLEAVVADPGRSAGDKRFAEQNVAAARQLLTRRERRWENFEADAANQQVPRAWIMPIPVSSPRPQL
jgi:cytidylate kinase